MMTLMTMATAKCFAKGCSVHQPVENQRPKADNQRPKAENDWKPCMGCRSYWIHVACGQFCSDCQPNNLETADTATAAPPDGHETKGRFFPEFQERERPPLSVKQSGIAKRLQDSEGFKEGKENLSRSLLGKRLRKPVAPPVLLPAATAATAATAAKTENNNTG